jgi:hypothetical protein
MPIFLLARLPLLLLTLFVHATLWTGIALTILRSERLTTFALISSLALYAVLSTAEFALSSGTLLFDQPWPLLPVTMNPAIIFFGSS